MSIVVMRLAPQERALYTAHLLALEPDERYLRFSAAMSDAAIGAYVRGIDLSRDRLYAAFADSHSASDTVGDTTGDSDVERDHPPVMRTPIGMVHLARGYGYAEVGVSVLAPYQRRYVASVLLEHCIAQCRQWGVSELFTHFLTQNASMARLADRFGMQIVAAGGESDGYLAVAPLNLGLSRRVPAYEAHA